jgi:hypothetical protein
MTCEEVWTLVSAQSDDNLFVSNDHRIKLEQVIIAPQEIPLIFRTVLGGRIKDEVLKVWLVGQEAAADGYKIIMREHGMQFGLASAGFSHDKHLVLVGWYGSLLSAFLAM